MGLVHLLRSRKALAKSIQVSSSINSKRPLSERSALMERLSVLIKEKISKFRCSDHSGTEELVLRASSDIYEEMKSSLNADHCSYCSISLITCVRCIHNVEDNANVETIYADSVSDWSSRKASKIHVVVFDDLIQRMPSLASVVLTGPLLSAINNAKSPFLARESIKLLSMLYKHDGTQAEELMSKKASDTLKECCSRVADTLKGALGNASLQKAKDRNEVLLATKRLVHYMKVQKEGLLTDAELCELQDTLKTVGENCESARTKQMCSQLSDTITGLERRDKVQDSKPKRSKTSKTPKSRKKQKK